MQKRSLLTVVRQALIGGSFGASIALSFLGFEHNSTRLQLLGIWLVGATIVGILADISYKKVGPEKG